MVGGREVFTCEMYDEVDARDAPKYTPYVNVYVVRGGAIVDNPECHYQRCMFEKCFVTIYSYFKLNIYSRSIQSRQTISQQRENSSTINYALNIIHSRSVDNNDMLLYVS